MIGIFDSGIGGLTVVSAIRARAPHADFLYFGDLANMPFGEKSEAELLEITKHAIQFLIAHGATEIVAACNSVSMLASGLRSELNIPIVEMSEPTTRMLLPCKACPAIEWPFGRGEAGWGFERSPILLVATEATVRSKMYERAFAEQGVRIESMAIPELASAIECGASTDLLRNIIRPSVQRAIALSAKTLILGCTQYPFARSVFEELFLEQEYAIDVFNPADAVADEVVARFDVKGSGVQQFFVSRSSEVFDAHVRTLFGSSQSTQMV